MARMETDGEGTVTRGNFFCDLRHSGIVRQVADQIARVTSLLHNFSHRKIALRVAGKVDYTVGYYFSQLCKVAACTD